MWTGWISWSGCRRIGDSNSDCLAEVRRAPAEPVREVVASVVSVLVSFASVHARPPSTAAGHAAKVTDHAHLPRTPHPQTWKTCWGQHPRVHIVRQPG